MTGILCRFVLGYFEGCASADRYVMLGLYLIALSAAGRIKSMKNPDDLAGNRNRNLAACSAVPQPTAPPLPIPPYVTSRLVSTLCSTGLFFFFRKVKCDFNNLCGPWKHLLANRMLFLISTLISFFNLFPEPKQLKL